MEVPPQPDNRPNAGPPTSKKNNPTAGMPNIRQDQDPPIIRKLFREMPSRNQVKFLPQNPGQSWQRACNKEALLTSLENEKTDLKASKLRLEEEERNVRDAGIDAVAIPSKTALDRIHRYETSNQRHRYRVEKRLEELQSRRREQARASGVLKPGEESFAKQSQDVL